MVFDARQVWTSTQLPQLSEVGRKLAELSRTETGAIELIEQLRQDPELCPRVISACNSPLATSAAATRIETLEQAVESLGVPVVNSLSLSLVVRETYLGCGMPLPYITQFWRQAVVKAVATESIGALVSGQRNGEHFFSGLLIDIGRLVLLRTTTEKYLALMERARQEHRPIWQLEQAELGFTAARIGSQIVEQWGFAPHLVQDLQTQSSPIVVLKQSAAANSIPSGGIVALASAIGDYFCSEDRALAWFRIRELTAEIIPISEVELHGLLQRVSSQFSAVAPELTVGETSLPDLETLKACVIEQLKPIQRRPETPTLATERAPTAGMPSERRGYAASAPTEGQKNFRDPLTQVYTAEFFEESLYKEVQRCRQSAGPLGVAFVQVDRFGKLLQEHGERFGDVVLQRVGGVLKDLLRTSDTIARFGYHFAILASEPTAKGMQRLADRIRGRVASENLVWSGQRVQLTVSVGATLALPGRRDEMIGAKVLATAKKAVLEAGSGEGNNVYFESMVEEIELQRLFMSDHLRFSRWLISRGVLDIPRVGKALLEYKQQQLRLGDLALRQELLSQEEVNQILREQDESQARFGDVAVRRDLLTEDQLVGLLILQQEDPLSVAELFLRRSILDQNHLQSLLKEYFSVVPWAAPLYPAAGNG